MNLAGKSIAIAVRRRRLKLDNSVVATDLEGRLGIRKTGRNLLLTMTVGITVEMNID